MTIGETIYDAWSQGGWSNDRRARAELVSAIDAALAAEREDILARVYVYGDRSAYVAVSMLCDDILDRNGGLLGRVRDRVMSIRARGMR